MQPMVDTLIACLRGLFQQVPDPRNWRKMQRYSVDDAGMAAFSLFFMQSPDFLDHQRQLQERQKRNACQSLFGMQYVPSDHLIGQQLDRAECRTVYPAFDFALQQLKQQQGLAPFLQLDERVLIAVDGLQFHSSEKIRCQQCSYTTTKGVTRYHHDVLCATLVAPQHTRALPLRPEFISRQDGANKRECEINAAKRWLHYNHQRYQDLRPIYLGDDLYSKQPFCRQLLERGGDFIFSVKPSTHRTLHENLRGLKLHNRQQTVRRTSGKSRIRRYRWYNGLPLTADEDSLQVNWFSVEFARLHNKKVTHRNSFITSLKVTRANVPQLADCGRARWKIDNESFNLFKNNRRHTELNFGHGRRELSNFLLALNLLAFAFHTTCDQLCEPWQQAQNATFRRYRFFEMLDILSEFACCEDWQHILRMTANPAEPRPLH